MSDSQDTSALRGEALPVAIFTAIALTMPFWFPLIGGYSGLDTKILIYVIFVLGFDLLLGFTGYLSFGHAAFFGTSAYTTGLTLLHFSPEIIPAMLMSLLVTFVLALLIGLLLTKRTGIYFAILTLAFASMLYRAALSIFSGWTGGDNGLTGIPTPELFGMPLQDTRVFLLVAFFAILGFWIALRIARSPFGLMLRAIKSNQQRLAYTGVDVSLYKLWGFIISGLYGGIAGSLMVIYAPYVATHFLHWTMSGEVVIMAVIGGVGTLIGPMIGAGFMMYFENVASAWIGEQWLLVLGVVFVLIVMYLPGGFVDGARRLRAWIRHRSSGTDAQTPGENDTHG